MFKCKGVSLTENSVSIGTFFPVNETPIIFKDRGLIKNHFVNILLTLVLFFYFQKAAEPKKAAPRAPKATNGEAKAAISKKPAAKASAAKSDAKEKQVLAFIAFSMRLNLFSTSME
jgi:hypothetical protein